MTCVLLREKAGRAWMEMRGGEMLHLQSTCLCFCIFSADQVGEDVVTVLQTALAKQNVDLQVAALVRSSCYPHFALPILVLRKSREQVNACVFS